MDNTPWTAGLAVDIDFFLGKILNMVKKNIIIFVILLIAGCAGIMGQAPADVSASRTAERAAMTFQRGNDYFKRDDYANALPAFEEIITEYAGTEPYEHALYLAAFCQYKLDRYKHAASSGEKYLKEFPKSTYYLNAMSLVGESYVNLGKGYEAVYYMSKYYLQTDDAVGRQKARDRVLELLPTLTFAELEKLHRIFMAEPVDEHILFRLAQREAEQGKKEEAKRDFDLLVRRFPGTQYLYDAEEYTRFIDLGKATQKAGVLLPLTGKFSNIGKDLLAVVRSFEKNKTLPFTIHVMDTKSDPVEATLAAAKLVEGSAVDFLIAPISSFESFAVCGYAYGKGIPIILPISEESRLEEMPLVFTQGQSTQDQARVVARYAAYDKGLRRIAVLYPEDEYHRGVAHTFAQEVTKHNREIVAMVSFPTDSITMQKEIEAIKKKEPDALFLAMDTDMIINVAPQVAYYGLETITLLGTDGFHNERVPRLGERYVEGAVFVAPSAIDESASRQMKNAGLAVNEFTARFYTILMRLQMLTDYERAQLPRLIKDRLGRTGILSVFEIKDGEFMKLVDIAVNEEQ